MSDSISTLFELIAKREHRNAPSLGDANLDAWVDKDLFRAAEVPFFQLCYPIHGFEFGKYFIVPAADLQEHTLKLEPGCEVYNLCCVTFGSLPNGDALTCHFSTGNVLVIPHGRIYNKEIHLGWKEGVGMPDPLPLSVPNLYQIASERYDSVEAFLSQYLIESKQYRSLGHSTAKDLKSRFAN